MMKVTVNTGNVRVCPRSLVGDDVIGHLWPLVQGGNGSFFDGEFAFAILRREPAAAVYDVIWRDTAFVRCWLCMSSAGASDLWSSATDGLNRTAVPVCPSGVPWLAVRIADVPRIATTAVFKPVWETIEDMEACLAWTILEMSDVSGARPN